MSIDFINSEKCKIDDKEMIYFRDTRQLRDKIIETVSNVGAGNFFSSTDENVKKVRESMAEYFFTLSLKKDSQKDWFLMQPQNDPPDFFLMTATDNPMTITLDAFELVEIPGRCQMFDEMMNIVQKKIDKGYSVSYNLLIFVNNDKSREWLSLFHEQLKNYYPFKTIWTVHLLWYKEKKDVFGYVVNRLRPYPVKHIEGELAEPHPFQTTPFFMEEIKKENKIFLSFKSDFAEELTKELRRIILKRKQS
jgi:hypothetical protein